MFLPESSLFDILIFF